jgi:hypothetical protein
VASVRQFLLSNLGVDEDICDFAKFCESSPLFHLGKSLFITSQ